jgi:hypothetical protein
VKDHRALEHFISAVRLANSRTRDMTLTSQPLDNVILIPRSRGKDLGSVSNQDS